MPEINPSATVVVWYRNDLRVHEQGALAAALSDGRPVRALYILCEKQWQQHGVAPLRSWYVLESLRELGDALARMGITLDILSAGDFAGVPRVLGLYLQEHAVARVYCGREYPLNELNRDRACAAVAAAAGVEIVGFDHSVLVPPRLLMSGQGTPYTVFTPYRRAWEKWLAAHGPLPSGQIRRKAGTPQRFAGHSVIDAAVSRLAVPEGLTRQWQPGETAARKQLSRFIGSALALYRQRRDFPALDATSVLSTALSAGTLSVTECWLAARPALQDPASREGAECWIGELAWRDFYRQIMANFPRLARGEGFREDTRYIQWSTDEARYEAWCEGRTGYPLVDAAQRQLLQTGWMHNRLRMVSAMFLTKHLFVDWRRGEDFFMRHLIDGDFAANNGGWQWSASTGTDAAPYFRVFSPIRQSERFDPDGEFIRRYIPELAELPAKWIHAPWKAPVPPERYPQPIVPHEGVKERVTEAFRAARMMMESQ